MGLINIDKSDKAGYDLYYRDNLSLLADLGDTNKYREIYEATRNGPYCKTGNTKGY